MRRFAALAAAGTLLAAAPSPPPAHMVAMSEVEVTFFSNHTYQIDIKNPTDWLILTLEPLSDHPSAVIPEGEALDGRLAELTGKYAEWLWVLFDGYRVEAFPEYIPPPKVAAVDPMNPPKATMRVRGPVPDTAKQFSFAYGLENDPYPIKFATKEGSDSTVWVTGPVESDHIDIAALIPPSLLKTIVGYGELGFTRILPSSPDHILLVVGLTLLSVSFLPTLAQVTAFTIAQAIALALTLSGVISLRPGIVGPALGLAIAYVAAENLFATTVKPTRLAVVFGLGLLFGMGMAGLALPRAAAAAALVGYNLGIGAALVTVMLVLLLALGRLRRMEEFRKRAVVPLSIAVALAGLWLTFSRIMGS